MSLKARACGRKRHRAWAGTLAGRLCSGRSAATPTGAADAQTAGRAGLTSRGGLAPGGTGAGCWKTRHSMPPAKLHHRRGSGHSQPRAPNGQYDFKPAASLPADAPSFPLTPKQPTSIHGPNPRTSRYRDQWGDLLIAAEAGGEIAANFHCDASGWWTHDKVGEEGDPSAVIFAYKSMDTDYWGESPHPRPNNLPYLEDKHGLSTWGAQVVCDMLNAGECPPSSEIASEALLSTWSADKRVGGPGGQLVTAMASARGGKYQLEQNPFIRRKQGGFDLGGGNALPQAAANAYAALLACSGPPTGYRTVADTSNLWDREPGNSLWDRSVADGGGYGAQPDASGCINGVYHGEDGLLLTKLLTMQATTKRMTTCGSVEESETTGAEQVRSLLLRPKLHNSFDHGSLDWEYMAACDRSSRVLGWAKMALWAALRDDEVSGCMTGSAAEGERSAGSNWILTVADAIGNAPDGSNRTLWGGVDQWRRGADLLLDSIAADIEADGQGSVAYLRRNPFARKAEETIMEWGTDVQRRAALFS